MMGRTHILIGPATAFVAAEALHAGLVEGTLMMASAAATSKLPDWDLKLPLVRHRGVTHSFLFAAFVSTVFAVAAAEVGAGFYAPPLVLGAMIGYAMHILADAMTLCGLGDGSDHPVFLLPPGMRFRVGDDGERVLFVAVIAAVVAFVWYSVGASG